ncbi:HK97 family phage prohead protease [Trueperella pyogenes]|uniref:HK97 family phage prohead protease n=1 Tax=Trueperella pyogenes TaxID=1661 RepID=UPI003249CBE8
MQVKRVTAQIKADTGEALDNGQFVAYASVFGNIDSYGDVVAKGAFGESLAAWKDSGNVIPVYFGHRMDELEYNIGHVIDAVEDDHGLLVKCQLDLDMPNGALAHRLIKARRLTQLSFAYDVLDSEDIEVDGEPATELRKLKIYEVSVVPIGANQQTEFLDVKALETGVKAGRMLSQKNINSLVEARDAIDRVIQAAREAEEPKADVEKAKDEDLLVKSEEPNRVETADVLRTYMDIAALAAQD